MSSNDDQIAQAERRFGVRFPEDYRHFLAHQRNMARFVPPADDFLMINAIAELIEVNEAGDFQERFPGSAVIGGDGSREMLTYDFRQEPRLWSCSTSPLRTGRPPSTRQLRSLPCSNSSPKPGGNGMTLSPRPPDRRPHGSCA